MPFAFLKRKSGTIPPTLGEEPVAIPTPAATLPSKKDFRAAGASRDAFIVDLIPFRLNFHAK